MTEQLFVKATERVIYAYVDQRALYGDVGAAKFDPFDGFWRLKNMSAVCCGLTGPSASIDKKGE